MAELSSEERVINLDQKPYATFLLTSILYVSHFFEHHLARVTINQEKEEEMKRKLEISMGILGLVTVVLLGHWRLTAQENQQQMSIEQLDTLCFAGQRISLERWVGPWAWETISNNFVFPSAIGRLVSVVPHITDDRYFYLWFQDEEGNIRCFEGLRDPNQTDDYKELVLKAAYKFPMLPNP